MSIGSPSIPLGTLTGSGTGDWDFKILRQNFFWLLYLCVTPCRFEADDLELQDEPLQIRIMDYDTYSANDAIGKVLVGFM